MNFTECKLGNESGNVLLQHKAFSLPLTDQQSHTLEGTAAMHHAVLGIRPDDVSISTAPTDVHTIAGEVLVTELLGGDMLVEAQIEGSRITVKTDPSFEADMGDKCHLSFDASRWHLFNIDSGAALF